MITIAQVYKTSKEVHNILQVLWQLHFENDLQIYLAYINHK